MIEADENGRRLRLITLEAVRHEIWSAGGRICVRRLFAIFDIDYREINARAGRSRQFREVIQELGTVEPYRIDIHTSMLVLLAFREASPHLIPPDDGFLD